MKMKRHVTKLIGKSGTAMRLVRADKPWRTMWMVYCDGAGWTIRRTLPDALKYLKENGVTDIKRTYGMSL